MRSVKRAILLLAGRARRMGRLTDARPKCLLDVGGMSILERALRSLRECGVSEAVFVVGYQSTEIRRFAEGRFSDLEITYIENDHYKNTNTAYSLWLAREHLDCDCFLLEGDILFDAGVIEKVMRTSGNGKSVWAAIPIEPGKDEGILLRRGEGELVSGVELVRDPSGRPSYLTHKCAGIQLLSAELARGLATRLDEVIGRGQTQIFADLVLGEMLESASIALCSLDGMRWAEVDSPEDLCDAERVF